MEHPQALVQMPEELKELSLDKAFTNSDLIRFLIDSNTGGLYVQNCASDSNDFTGFTYVLRLLIGMNSSNFCLKSALKLDYNTSLWTLRSKSSDLPSDSHSATVLLSTLSTGLQCSLIINMSSIVLLPSNWDHTYLFPQIKKNLEDIVSIQDSKLKHILLIDMNSKGNIEDFISISRLRLDLIYLWNCAFSTKCPIWSTFWEFMKVVTSICSDIIRSFVFTIRIDGHVTQIVHTYVSSFVTPNSSDHIHGLFIPFPDDLPNVPSIEKISLLAFCWWDMDLPKRSSVQSNQCLSLIGSRKWPSLRYLLLRNIYFDVTIESYIPILQLNLDLIYLGFCKFTTSDPVWSLLSLSMERFNLILGGGIHIFQFIVRINGHTTQIVMNQSQSFFKPNSPAPVCGLILPLGEEPPNDLSFDTISFLVFFPSKANSSIENLRAQSQKSLDSIRNRKFTQVPYFFLKDVPLNDMEEMLDFIQEFKPGVFVLGDLNFSEIKEPRPIILC